MRQMLKRGFSVALAVVMCFGVMPISVFASNAYYINGATVRNDDFSSSPDECWDYANNVYNKIWGQRFSSVFNDSNNSLRNLSDSELTLTAEHLKAYVTNAALGSSLRICNSSYLHSNDGWGHSQIIVQKDANGFTVFEGGLSSSPYRSEKYYTWSEYMNTGWLGGTYAYIKYIKWPGASAYTNGNNPVGVIDIAYGDMGRIRIRGWAFDMDEPTMPLQIHVYVGGAAGSGAPGYSILADLLREDVGAAYAGVGNYHGYDSTISVYPSGEQTLYIYACNVGSTGSNKLIGTRSVTISKDTELPKISDVEYVIKDYGYDIVCTVTDNIEIDRVQFPTWTLKDGQDDLNSEYWPTDTNLSGTIVDDKVTYRVYSSNHNNENGTYITHIYAYDKCGNCFFYPFEVNYCKHIISNWIIDKKSTCTDEGSKHNECTICGKTIETVSIPKLPHTYNTTVTKPTCTENGYTTYTCACGDTYIADTVAALGHIDVNTDGKCDRCDVTVSDENESSCSCICHKGGFSGFIYLIIRMFWKIFGMNKMCECGTVHY